MELRLASSRVVTGVPGEPLVRAATVIAEAGVITEVIEGVRPGVPLVEGFLVSGFVDTHCHGGAGAHFTDADPAAVVRAIQLHRRHGSTTLFASTVSEDVPVLQAQLDRLRPLVECGELAGVHLEGPFLAPAKAGAHVLSRLRDPASDLVEQLVSDPIVAMITLAPERQGALAAIKACAAHGVAPAIGHTDADADQARAAIAAGARVVTHLYNAMRPIHHRDPGPIPTLLTNPDVMLELICDGVHLDADVVALTIATAGIDRVALVTDAMAAAGVGDGHWRLGEHDVQVRSGVARLTREGGEQGAIAGSTLTMDRAVEFLVQQVGISVPDAAIMASATPARWHGLGDVGELAPGRVANWCVLRDDGRLDGVAFRGQWLTPPTSSNPAVSDWSCHE